MGTGVLLWLNWNNNYRKVKICESDIMDPKVGWPGLGLVMDCLGQDLCFTEE